MAVVTLTMASSSYGEIFEDNLYKNDGTETGIGVDFGNIETGTENVPTFMYLRHDGIEPIYSCSYYLRTIGTEWGGYVSTADTAENPFNPNWFRDGGLSELGVPKTATVDYELMRTSAANNSEMGLRVHYDRADNNVRTTGLGYSNAGLNFSSILLQQQALDYSLSGNTPLDGYIHPEPIDGAKLGKVGDEARIGLSVKMPEDIVGSGYVQFAFAVTFRYTL